jgi:hypothetical protein
MRLRLGLALAAALALFGVAATAAQEPASSGAPAAAPAAKALEPVPAVDDESALGRFGIVTLGSFPIMLLYSDFSFDLGKYVFNGFDSDFAPWPFKSEYSEPPTDSEKALRIGVAIGASVAVGAIDYLIRSSKAKKARLRRESLLELAAEASAGGGSVPLASPESGGAP